MKINRIAWPDVVPVKLIKACGNDVDVIKNEVECGICHLYELNAENTNLLIVTRGEESLSGKELVIVCAAGHGMKHAGQLLIDNAKRLGFDSIRYHASQATHRLYVRYGFGGVESERVYKIDVGVCNGF